MDDDELNTLHEDRARTWLDYYNRSYGPAGVEKLASQYRDGQHCECLGFIHGGFNICFCVLFDDGAMWAVRFPIAGSVMHPEEKVRREVAVLKFVQEKTQIPVPKLIAYGSASDNHDPEIGPYLISEWVRGKPLVELLEQLPRPEWGPVLRDDIDDDIFYKIYSQMADILLELASHDFGKIGALIIPDGDGEATSWPICTRPLTRKMNEIQRAGYVVVDDCTAPPFDNVTDYMKHLLQQNMTHLYKQRNSVDDEEDARSKFILRRRLQALVPHFTSKFDSGPFTLFCDDVHPRNILVDENTYKITAIIDWEWTYAAPHDFLVTPPSWLVFGTPTSWIESDEVKFKKQFTIFLQALEDAESRREKDLALEQPNEQRISTAMRQSFEDGTFWFVQLLLQSFNFDGEALWPHLEPFLRERGLLEVGIPDEKEVEEFVAMKMRDLHAYKEELQKKSGEQHAESEVDPSPLASDHTNGPTNDDAAATAKPLDELHEQSQTHLGDLEPTTDPTKLSSNQTTRSAGHRTDDHLVSLNAQGKTDTDISDLPSTRTSERQRMESEDPQDQDTMPASETEKQRTWLEMMIPSCIFN
ncbi:hypothetical protein KCU81_g1262, partial [Aureobasidium melanogenum]|uniref:Aminoglycoside phosphotransferase domain-containing protein n=1 Tax=Aureobasidium melanogenum (strain CBS 110374) TaxID=1043003 RepID=A0A074W4P1_AURM1